MRRGWARLRGSLVALGWAVLALGLSPAGGAEVEVENLRVGFAGVSQNNLFKVGAWTPVWVQIKGGDDRFSGLMEVEVPDDDGTPTYFHLPVEVPSRQSIAVVTYARPGSRDPNFLIRLRNPKGRQVGRTVDGSTVSPLSPVHSDETLLLTLGKPSGVEQVPALPVFAGNPNNPGSSGSSVTIARIDSTAGAPLPGRWYGYDSAAAIILDTNDKDLMAALEVRGQALVDWVARGGHLVVAVGGNWQAVRDSVLAPLLPGVPIGQERLSSLDLKTLDTFAGAAKSISSPESPPVMVTKLDRIEERGGKVLSAAAGIPLVVRGPHGFGRVTLVALDADAKPFSAWPDRPLFWVRALDLRRSSAADPSSTVRLNGGGRRMYQSGTSDLAGELRQALEQFSGVKLIPFGWVAFFIFVYILLIGPGDYFFLKKVVKRMELTWITFPLIVATVSLAAYFAAYLVKGKDLRINKVDVVDIDQAAGLARGNTFFNIFSPQNRDYDVAVRPLDLDRDTPSPKGGSAAAVAGNSGELPKPPAGTEVLVSWLGVPGTGFGGMGNSSRMGFAGGGYTSGPPGSSEYLEGVRVPIWSTKLLTARWAGPAPILVESDLLPVGADRLSGTVTNRTGTKLTETILAFNKHVYQLGTIAAGETVRVELKPDRQLSGLLRSKQGTVTTDPSTSEVRIDRSSLALALMFHDSQGTASGETLMTSDPLHYLDLTGQLALDRPMLVGRIDRPATQLILGNAPAPPKVEQTTMLRVILPLSQPPEEK